MVKKREGGVQDLSVRAKQSLLITPQLRQGIEILQYSSQELEGFLTQTMEENPFLTEEIASEDKDGSFRGRDRRNTFTLRGG